MTTTETEQQAQTTDDPQDDQLATLPADRLASMLRDKRRAEADVRARLRDAEAERDQLRTAVTGWQRAKLTELATHAGVAPTALGDLDTAVQLDSVLDDAGLIDAGKANAALTQLRNDKPHLFRQGVTTSGVESFTGGQTAAASEASWADVLR